MARDYKGIKAWQLADDLVVLTYKVVKSFPREEQFRLVDQMCRAVVSVAANIAEGAARDTQRDYLHFLVTAKGSLAELGYYIHLSARLGFLDGVTAEQFRKSRDQVAYTLQGLIRVVRAQVKP